MHGNSADQTCPFFKRQSAPSPWADSYPPQLVPQVAIDLRAFPVKCGNQVTVGTGKVAIGDTAGVGDLSIRKDSGQAGVDAAGQLHKIGHTFLEHRPLRWQEIAVFAIGFVRQCQRHLAGSNNHAQVG